MKILLSLLFLFNFMSCNSDTKSNYSRGDMMDMALEADPNMSIEIGTMEKAAVTCGEYKIPCNVGYLIKLKNMEVKALYYESQEDALKSAKRIKGFIARNWVFDDVRGEPILERLVTQKLDAKPAF